MPPSSYGDLLLASDVSDLSQVGRQAMADLGTGQRSDRLGSREVYLHPELECDVVMKGGITSGVLYPMAVCELATAYRLRNVGGTSAGAIAAAAAAAAEFGRASAASGSGFDGLAALPEWLGSDDHLVGLFQPASTTKRIHSLLMRAVRPNGSRVGLAGAMVWSGIRSRRWWMPTLGAAPGAFLVIATIAGANSPWSWLAALLAVTVSLVGLSVGALIAVLLGAGESLEANMYGIVSGSQAVDGRESLSDWLTDEIDTLAGVDLRGSPLTFGDLWAGPEKRATPSSPAINLEMLTTNVTEGRPYRLPDELGPSFAFQEDEFRRLFPARVVDHLMTRARGPRTPQGLIPLPPVRDLPVVVATRMSLSFPILISAVPLYAVDRSMYVGAEERFERTWFSDGGITSNFPISFFDTLLPKRPTFGINLRPFHPGYERSEEECRNVWMPRTNSGGILEWWARWPDGQGLRSVMKFLRAIVDSMQNWVDNQQTRVPGYRDRIVHISHTDDEGGMNLAMPPETLRRLAERGRCAGERLVDYYTNPPENGPGRAVSDSAGPEPGGPRVVSWENHRWIRLRTSLALVSGAIQSMSAQFDDDYAADLDAPIGSAPGYPFRNLDQQALAQALMNRSSTSLTPGDGEPRVTLPTGLRELADAIREVESRGPNVPLDVGRPRPAPVFRIAPGGRPAARSAGPDDEAPA